MRTLSATLLAEQLTDDHVPYIHCIFESQDLGTTYDYSQDGSGDRILSIDFTEGAYEGQAYSGGAEILLRNNDRAIADLRGYHLDLGLGYVTGAGNEYATYPRMWVIAQNETSLAGMVTVRLILWDIMKIMSMVTADNLGGALTSPAFQKLYDRTHTPLEIMQDCFTACGVTLTDTSDDDGITDTFLPYMEVNYQSLESYQAVIYRAINCTKKYIRPGAASTASLVYPQAADAVDETYYTVQTAGYIPAYIHNEQMNEKVPNKVVVYANEAGSWDTTGSAEDATAAARFDPTGKGNMIEYNWAGPILTQGDADNFASARLVRASAETMAAWFSCPHDSRLELYDRVQIIDPRGY